VLPKELNNGMIGLQAADMLVEKAYRKQAYSGR